MTLQTHGPWKGLIRFASVCQITAYPATAQKTLQWWVEHLHACIIIFMSFVFLHLKFPSSHSFEFQIGQTNIKACRVFYHSSLLVLMCMSAALCSVVDVGGLVVWVTTFCVTWGTKWENTWRFMLIWNHHIYQPTKVKCISCVMVSSPWLCWSSCFLFLWSCYGMYPCTELMITLSFAASHQTQCLTAQPTWKRGLIESWESPLCEQAAVVLLWFLHSRHCLCNRNGYKSAIGYSLFVPSPRRPTFHK